MPTALDNGRRAPRKMLAAVVRRLIASIGLLVPTFPSTMAAARLGISCAPSSLGCSGGSPKTCAVEPRASGRRSPSAWLLIIQVP
jgi:hypothetical protein